MEPFPFTLISYNIHHGRGMDRHLDLRRIVHVIRDAGADVACLQEVDCRVMRSRLVNQPAVLAKDLGMEFVYGPTLIWPGGQRYGNLLLSRLPIEAHRTHLMPGRGEQRGVIEARITTPAGTMTVFCTHWGLPEGDRGLHAAHALEAMAETPGPVLFAGDLNEPPDGPSHDILRESGLVALGPQEATCPADDPDLAIDHIYGSEHFTARDAYAIPSLASDHRPVVAELELRAEPGIDH